MQRLPDISSITTSQSKVSSNCAVIDLLKINSSESCQQLLAIYIKFRVSPVSHYSAMMPYPVSQAMCKQLIKQKLVLTAFIKFSHDLRFNPQKNFYEIIDQQSVVGRIYIQDGHAYQVILQHYEAKQISTYPADKQELFQKMLHELEDGEILDHPRVVKLRDNYYLISIDGKIEKIIDFDEFVWSNADEQILLSFFVNQINVVPAYPLKLSLADTALFKQEILRTLIEEYRNQAGSRLNKGCYLIPIEYKGFEGSYSHIEISNPIFWRYKESTSELRFYQAYEKVGKGTFNQVLAVKTYAFDNEFIEHIKRPKVIKLYNQEDANIQDEIDLLELTNQFWHYKVIAADNNPTSIIIDQYSKDLLQLIENDELGNMQQRVQLILLLLHRLTELHANNILHNDIKPANIFCHTEDDNVVGVVIADYNLSAKLSNYRIETGKGTPIYFGPENIDASGKKLQNARQDLAKDIFATGLVIAEILGFELDRRCVYELAGAKIKRGQIVFTLSNCQFKWQNADLDILDDILKLLNQMLAIEPTKRISAVDALFYLEKIYYSHYYCEGYNEILHKQLNNLRKNLLKKSSHLISYPGSDITLQSNLQHINNICTAIKKDLYGYAPAELKLAAQILRLTSLPFTDEKTLSTSLEQLVTVYKDNYKQLKLFIDNYEKFAAYYKVEALNRIDYLRELVFLLTIDNLDAYNKKIAKHLAALQSCYNELVDEKQLDLADDYNPSGYSPCVFKRSQPMGIPTAKVIAKIDDDLPASLEIRSYHSNSY